MCVSLRANLGFRSKSSVRTFDIKEGFYCCIILNLLREKKELIA